MSGGCCSWHACDGYSEWAADDGHCAGRCSAGRNVPGPSAVYACRCTAAATAADGTECGCDRDCDRRGASPCCATSSSFSSYTSSSSLIFPHRFQERVYVCNYGMQKIGQGRDAARKRAGAEVRKPALFARSKGLCTEFVRNLRLAFALRRDGTAGGVRARGRRRRAPSSTPRARAAAPTTGGGGRLDRAPPRRL